MLFVSARCNNHCLFCAQQGLGPDGDPTAAAIEAALAQPDEGGVAFVGGEPTLHPRLLEWVRGAREGGASHVLVQTNGRRLPYEGYAAALAEAGASAVEISLQGHRAAIHEYHTEAPGSFRETIGGIQAAARAGLEVGVTTQLTRSNFRHLSSLVRAAAKLGVKALHLSGVQSVGGAATHGAKLLPPIGMLRPQLERATREAAVARLPLVFSGLPLCAGDRVDGHTLGGAAGDLGHVGYGANCDDCEARARCPGIQQSQLEHLSPRELRPVSTPAATVAARAQLVAAAAPLFAGLGRTIA